MTSEQWEKVTEPWVGKEDLWRDRDNQYRFSTDGGVTYYSLDEALGPDGNPVIHHSADLLEEKVFQALGAASSCWDNLAGAGIFESERAKKVGDDLVSWIKKHYDKKEQPSG